MRVKRTADEIGHTELVGALNAGRGSLGRDHDYRDVANPVVTVHDREHVKTVHPRHHDIEQHQRDSTPKRPHLGNGLKTVLSLDDIEVVPDNTGEQGPVHRGVVNDEDGLLTAGRRVYGCLAFSVQVPGRKRCTTENV